MIKGMHGMFFTPEAAAARAFIRERLGFSHVDAGEGWLIFDVPMTMPELHSPMEIGGAAPARQAEFAIHPGSDTHHELSFWCDDIEHTVEELAAKDVSFRTPIEDQGWGLVTTFELPGSSEVMLYQPKHRQP